MALRKDRPQVAIIGTGQWGRNLVRNFYDLGTIKLVVDNNENTVKQMLTEHPGIKGSTDLAKVWQDEDIKGVVIAAPAENHYQLAKEALLVGKDVLVEKPLSLSVEDGEELVSLAKKENRILMVGHILWYHPAFLKLKELVDEGALGKLHYIYSNRLNFGKIRTKEDAFWSLAPHDVSMILGLVGEMPLKVHAFSSNFVNPDISDLTISHFDFPNNIKGQVMASWLHPFKEQRLVVVGQDKMAVFDDTANWDEKLILYPHTIEWPNQIPTAKKAQAQKISLTEAEPLKQECLAFLEAINTRIPPLSSGEEGLRVLKLLTATQESIKSKETILLEDKKKH